jgi:hypothetical protein
VVLRPRLIERLNEGFSAGCKLTLISAPAGFGKTTLISEWLAGSKRPVAWLPQSWQSGWEIRSPKIVMPKWQKRPARKS